jgi:hypothetical protein
VAPIFSLALNSTAELVAVNEALVDELAAERVGASLEPDQRLIDDEVDSGRSRGRLVGRAVVYDVEPAALVYRLPDTASVVALVRGKSVVDAEQALARFGRVRIDMWPDFIDRVPDQPARISVTVASPVSGT